MGVPMNEFLKLTRIPIVIYYGDFIAEKPDTAVGRINGEVNMKWQSNLS